MTQVTLWPHQAPKPWKTTWDVAHQERNDTESQPTDERHFQMSPTSSLVTFQNERNFYEDTPTVTSVMIAEPPVWSRLKIIYSFEYNMK